jgi:hypothetical protein
MDKTKTDNSYEGLYWKEVEENIQLNEEIEKLKWKIHLLERKIQVLEIKNICK